MNVDEVLRAVRLSRPAELTRALLLACGGFCTIAAAAAATSPPIMLAHKFQQGLTVEHYLVSEKLDGVRARWNGRELISRGGKIFAAPGWFISGFPPERLDGELWSQRGDYQNIAAITARHQPHAGWRSLKFMIFDMPQHGGNFGTRVSAMQALPTAPYLQPLEQGKNIVPKRPSLYCHSIYL